jgi:tubulin monoglycylase TTLL3/8
VLVTDLNPLTIWFWNKPYLRFPAADYNDENLHDRFIHLTNNSVVKNSKHLEIVGDGNMWYIEQLKDHLKSTYGRDIWEEDIVPKVKDIIIHSLQAVQDVMDTRKGSMELLGYDIMIDDQFKPWLIEVNSSPTMEYSTGVTKHLAQNVMESIVKVISDYIMAPKNVKKKDIDTGDFDLIYKGKKYTDKGLNLYGVNLC